MHLESTRNIALIQLGKAIFLTIIDKGVILMGNIFQKAQQEQVKGFYQEIPDKLEGLPADTPDWKDALKSAIDDIIRSGEQQQAED